MKKKNSVAIINPKIVMLKKKCVRIQKDQFLKKFKCKDILVKQNFFFGNQSKFMNNDLAGRKVKLCITNWT